LASAPVVGIDVSKKSLDIFIDQVNQRFTIDNTDLAIAGLADRLRAAAVRLVVIEATGRYHRRLDAFARRMEPKPDQIQRKNQAILSDLIARRRSLVQVRVAEKNRAHDDLSKLAASQSRELLRLIEQQIEDLDREIAR
jgi:transposase